MKEELTFTLQLLEVLLSSLTRVERSQELRAISAAWAGNAPAPLAEVVRALEPSVALRSRWLYTRTGFPEGLCSLHQWTYSKPNWMWSWAAISS